MVIARCEKHAPRTKKYVLHVEPAHHPNSDLICGKHGCIDSAFIYLDENDSHSYRAANRILGFPGREQAKCKANDNIGALNFE